MWSALVHYCGPNTLNYINADCHQVFNVVNFTIGILAALLGTASSVQALYRRNFFVEVARKLFKRVTFPALRKSSTCPGLLSLRC